MKRTLMCIAFVLTVICASAKEGAPLIVTEPTASPSQPSLWDSFCDGVVTAFSGIYIW